ncbi:MAG: hypothetical protein OEZ39_19920 [Gammaproteobacteria bacterium]|nr:hypothetical protein [Gammaproteobacteria bacterium]MDH5654136.1 hypothetical protein [Gammaproteobacteria bacterium]
MGILSKSVFIIGLGVLGLTFEAGAVGKKTDCAKLREEISQLMAKNAELQAEIDQRYLDYKRERERMERLQRESRDQIRDMEKLLENFKREFNRFEREVRNMQR